MFFERPDSGERAILVHIELSADSDNEDPRELEELALSAGADPVEFLTGSRAEPSPKFFLGAGKVEELSALVQQHQAELVIFNHALSPAQERNLEREIQCRVLDRTGLILDIFAQRARTHEGKLQVELAQLEHMSTRLVRGWTHLERQKGGIGLRGRGKPSWRPTDGCCGSGSNRSRNGWGGYAVSGNRDVEPGAVLKSLRWRWWVTPMPASRPCSTG